jgi:phytoene dehydrogenase-like protein
LNSYVRILSNNTHYARDIPGQSKNVELPRISHNGRMDRYDAVVVGAGPNGLAAAVTLADAGRSVLVLEAADRIGGGTRTEQVTLPGFHHDICSAIHPYAAGSPYLRTLPLARHGLEWVHPEIALGHPMDPDRAVFLHRSLEATIDGLGRDGAAYGRVMRQILRDWDSIEPHLFGPLARLPRHPLAMARFGARALASAAGTARRLFGGEEAQALFAGNAAHAFLPLTRPLTASFGWFLMAGAHLHGWPAAKGGSQAIANALASLLESNGGVIETGVEVRSLSDVPPSDTVLFDVTPDVFSRIAGDRLPTSYLRKAGRFRRGPAAFKLDIALDGPIPWQNPDLHRTGTVHLGGPMEDVMRAEQNAWSGVVDAEPFVLVAQQSLFDSTRAPTEKHTVWAYAHVPHGSVVDFTDAVLDRISAYAPGFRDRILGVATQTPSSWERHNPNYVGGDISGGAHTFSQLVFRPFPQANPYATPLEGVYLCSSSTPPGGGTHGMCGHNAALAALER